MTTSFAIKMREMYERKLNQTDTVQGTNRLHSQYLRLIQQADVGLITETEALNSLRNF
jgi:uncharacterized protein YbbC (DUF1343 family)